MASHGSHTFRLPSRPEPGPLLSWSVTTSGARAWLAVSGELTPVAADRLHEALDWLRCAGHCQITVDLGGVSACNAAGLDALLSVLRRAVGTADGEVVLTNPSRSLRRLLGLGDDTVMQGGAGKSPYPGRAHAFPSKLA